MNPILKKICSIFRKLVITSCLIPGSLLYGSSRSHWKNFLYGLLNQANELGLQASQQGRPRLQAAGFLLLLSRRIHDKSSVWRGIASMFRDKTKYPSVSTDMIKEWIKPIAKGKIIPIEEYAHRILGEDNFAGQIVAVVAHWDKDCKIDPYVRYMLEHFRSLGWKVVLSSASKPEDDPLPPLDGLVYRTCDGYDFTSWKAALHCFPSLLQAKELILCNDSVFGPVGSYKTMHDAMEAVDCDFWSATSSGQFMPHLQSFYLVFRPAALSNPGFIDFFDKVSFSSSRKKAIALELRLTLWLESHDLRPAAYSSLKQKFSRDYNPSQQGWKTIIDAGVPLIKRDLLLHNPTDTDTSQWAALLKNKGYPLHLILDYALRIGVDLTPSLCDGQKTGQWPADVLSLQDATDLDAVDPDALPEDRPPLGIFLHVFYVHLLPELAACLDNFPRNAHVYVSTDTEEKAVQIRDAWAALSFAVLEVRVLPNQGWDIAPFLLGFTDVVEQYPVLVRLHAKASTQMPKDIADAWRGMLYSSLAGSKDRVRRLEALFAQQPDLGMIVPPPVPWYAANINMAGNHGAMQRLLEPHGITLDKNTAIDFPMGSMFWCRSAALSPWLHQNLQFEDFEPSNAEARDGSLAHALERLFLFGCGIAGLRWGRVAPDGFNKLAPSMKTDDEPLENLPTVEWEPLDTPPPLGRDARILPAGNRPEMVLILPRIHPKNFSGGPNTALLFAAEVARHGYNIHCLSEMPPTGTTQELQTHLLELLHIDKGLADKFRLSCMSSPVTLHANDRLLTTAWWTIRTARTLASRMEKQRFAYFIQDFEPLFYPWGEDHAKAMLSYDNDFLPVINESSLAQLCCMVQPGSFANSDFRADVQVFTPAVDRRYFHPEKRTGKHTLLFYARPVHPRNLYHFGMEAISQLVNEQVIDAENWDVHLMGDTNIPNIDFGNGVVARTLPWMGFAEYAAHIRQASVGLSLMLSPHTSYMPLELAAAGVPVVTTNYLNKDAEFLRNLSPHIIGADPTLEDITAGLREAVRMATTQPDLRVDNLKTPENWHEAFAPVMPRFLRFMETGE